MFMTYNYPGFSSFECVRVDNRKEARVAAGAWWDAVHASNGPCAPGGGGLITNKEAAKRVFNEFAAEVFAPGKVPPGLPLPGWKLIFGEGYVLHEPEFRP